MSAKKNGAKGISPVLWILLALAVILIVGLVIWAAAGGDGGWSRMDPHSSSGPASSGGASQPTGDPGQADGTGLSGGGEQSQTTEPAPRIAFPHSFEDGKLEIRSLFLYSGANPDNGWETGENIGALEIVNTSEEHLVSLDVTVSLRDGTELTFRAEEIPAGQKVLAFSPENAEAYNTSGVETLEYEAVFSGTESLIPGTVSAEVSGTRVTLTNNGATALSGLELSCHTVLDGVYFGGLAFTYPVEDLTPGGSAAVDAADCFLGDAAASWLGEAR